MIYTYLVTDTTFDKVNLKSLKNEITDSDITIKLNSVTSDGYEVFVNFAADLDAIEKQILDLIISAHTAVSQITVNDDGYFQTTLAENKNQLGHLRVTVEPRITDVEYILTTHNFCDKTTWYTASSRITDEVLSTSDNLKFTSINQNWIDLSNGKVLREELIQPYFPIMVTVDGVSKVESTIDVDGDFIVNYADGYIEFNEPTTGQVLASYNIPNSSVWVLNPPAGKYLRIEHAEIQISSDLEYNDTIIFEVLTGVVNNVGTVKAGRRMVYKSFGQIVDEAIGSYPLIPAIAGPRGTANSIIGFPFRFGEAVLLDSSKNEQLKIYLLRNNVFGGTRATITFYCTELAL